MTKDQLTNLLLKKSIEATYQASEGSKDPTVIQESIIRASRYRAIFYCVQILGLMNYPNNQKGILFGFSPDYLLENYELALTYNLDRFEWIFKLPFYESGQVDIFLEASIGNITIRSEESVANWLAESSIEITKESEAIYNLSIKELVQSIVHTESD